MIMKFWQEGIFPKRFYLKRKTDEYCRVQFIKDFGKKLRGLILFLPQSTHTKRNKQQVNLKDTPGGFRRFSKQAIKVYKEMFFDI